MSIEAVRAEVSYQQPIPRQLTHRAAVAEVFVTSLTACGPGEFVAGAQLPRMHAYYGDHLGALADRHDPLLVMEAARQAAIAITHQFFDVPLDFAFMVRTFNGIGANTSAWRTGDAPADLVLEVHVTRSHQQGERLHGVDMVLKISCDTVPLMTVDGSFSWSSPSRWARLRSAFRETMGLPETVGPVLDGTRADAIDVGRENQRNVIVGPPAPTTAETTVAVLPDPRHPFLFDHALDHLPGSLLIEAARQTALALLLPDSVEPPRLLEVRSTFARFAELDRPCECRAELITRTGDRSVVRCAIRQEGEVAAEFELTFLAERSEG